MIIVDTSILIGYFKGMEIPPYDKMDFIIDNDIPYGINNHIYLELLQGSRNESEYDILKEYLSTLPFYELKYGKKSYENAARLNIKCRENGITIRSTIDLIIAETALENNLYILHNDNDYTNMAKIITELKIY
ncbi:MAG: PIN domain nuclease [Planctomycetaceae bacterium]|jgi:predicted nucleic acid-binding protein|nr:PIN domain nuclease [Planctomycetaceae bacterium]